MKTRNTPCIVEIGCSWDGYKNYKQVARFPSIRAAKRSLANVVYPHIDHIARVCYSIRLRVGPRPEDVRLLTMSLIDHVVESVKYDRWDNSIGARTARGETCVC